MDEKNGKNPLLALTVATVLFAALGVIVYNPAPYKGIRPSVPVIQEPSEKIRARLWQDPFQAVLDQEKTSQADKKPDQTKPAPGAKSSVAPCISITKSPGLEKKLTEEINKKKDVTILAVMVLGGPYDADIEFRIRQRYAVLAGLNVLGYHPDDPTHIDFLRICQLPAENKQDTKLSLTNIIPFEWLSDDQNKSVLLLWLTDESFRDNILGQLDFLRGNINKQLPFKIIGPATSTTLLKMIKENTGTDLQFYSATATVDNDILMQEANSQNSVQIQPETFLKSDHIIRTIRSDKELAIKLSEELKNRGIQSSDHIALVAEWDTDYGRLLPETFKEVFAKDFFGEKEVNKHVHRFSYLRGIDGKLPGEQNGSAKDQKKSDGSNKEERDVKRLEEPLGKSQYDYLRRLAEMIAHLEDKYGPGAIKAIGVLGNDFYDKFLVLQALGQRFPDRIFFTTDLDARYLHPANIQWTRNLLVGSTFGLQLRDDLQRDVPPFRDSYQTSVFYASLRAFYHGAGTPNNPLKPEDVNRILQPRIFEIGRYNAIDLTMDAKENNDPSYQPANKVKPLQDFPNIGWQRFLLLAAVLLVLSMVLWVSCTWDSSNTKFYQSIKQFFTNQLTISLLVIIFLIILSALFLNHFILNHSSEEPLSFTEGISIWPTEIIRSIALILSWIFFGLSLIWLNSNEREINNELCLGDDCKKTSPANWSRLPTNDNSIDTNATSLTYFRDSQIAKRLFWVIPITVIYFFFCFLIITFFGRPINPLRGTVSGIVNHYLLLFTIFSFLFLTFFVLDAIMQCRRFIARFYHKQPQWMPYSLHQFTEKWVEDPDLSKWVGGKAEEALSNWMLIQLIARRTEVVGKLIFLPFIVWFLLFISRHYYFDNWRTPLSLAIVISLSAVLAWGCAVYLRHSAEKLRTVVSNRLGQQLIGAYAADPPRKADADRIQYVLNEVKGIKTGAFASYVQQPVLQSLLVPLGGISGLKILELLSNLG
jgi:hypothetical protein